MIQRKPVIEVDFNNCDPDGMVRLNVQRAINSIRDLGHNLFDGMEVLLVQEIADMQAVVRLPGAEGVWRAEFVMDKLVEALNP